MRGDGRQPDRVRRLTFERRYTRQAPASVLLLVPVAEHLAPIPFGG
jgi:hypothetical protein